MKFEISIAELNDRGFDYLKEVFPNFEGIDYDYLYAYLSYLEDCEIVFKDYEYINSEVVEHREVDGKQRDVFQFKIDMIEYNVVSDNESKYDIGDSVKICYDKNNPINIISEFDSKRIILPILCGIFGALTIGLMIVYIMIYVSFQRTQGNNKSIKKALND